VKFSAASPKTPDSRLRLSGVPRDKNISEAVVHRRSEAACGSKFAKNLGSEGFEYRRVGDSEDRVILHPVSRRHGSTVVPCPLLWTYAATNTVRRQQRAHVHVLTVGAPSRCQAAVVPVDYGRWTR
jgi:hypothetical protein